MILLRNCFYVCEYFCEKLCFKEKYELLKQILITIAAKSNLIFPVFEFAKEIKNNEARLDFCHSLIKSIVS